MDCFGSLTLTLAMTEQRQNHTLSRASNKVSGENILANARAASHRRAGEEILANATGGSPVRLRTDLFLVKHNFAVI